MSDVAMNRTGFATRNLAPPAPPVAPDLAPAPPAPPKKSHWQKHWRKYVATGAAATTGLVATVVGVANRGETADPTAREPGTSAAANPGAERRGVPTDPLGYCEYILSHPSVTTTIEVALDGVTVSPEQCVQHQEGVPYAIAHIEGDRGSMDIQVAPAGEYDQNEPSLEPFVIRGADWAYLSNAAPNLPYVAMGKDGMAVVVSYSPKGTISYTEAHAQVALDTASIISANR